MSTAVVVPPPSSSSLVRRLPRLTRRARQLVTAVNLHLAGVAALLILALYTAGHLLLLRQALDAHGPQALEAQQRLLGVAEVQAQPLRGLDEKLTVSTHAADAFYQARLPFAYSEVAAELGALTKRQSVRLARVQYAEQAVLPPPYTLTEVHMDASVSGEYRPVVQFLNSLERDPMFFVIDGINLTGQQSGQVNLRVRLTTYLRVPDAAEATMNGVPTSSVAAEAEAPLTAGGVR